MIKKGLWIVIMCNLVLLANGLSQQLSHQVIVPLAGLASYSKISYSQTAGETAIELTGCSEYLFTQGFQQPGMRFSDVTRPEGMGVKVYPNPATDYVIIELFGDSEETFKIDIINVMGRVVFSEKREFSDQFWYKEPHNIEGLLRGLYLIRITSERRMMNRIFKIEKI
jgi:hypothetical protein